MTPEILCYFEKLTLIYVLENESICSHQAKYDPSEYKGETYLYIESVPMPRSKIIPPQNGKDWQAQVFCPVCGRVYEKASKELAHHVKENISNM